MRFTERSGTMFVLSNSEMISVSGGLDGAAEGMCRAYVSNMGGIAAVAAGAGATGGLGFVAGAGLYGLGFGLGGWAAEFICE